MGVLIVPLWNWNEIKRKADLKKERSNRTFMELKSEYFRAAARKNGF